MGEHKLSREDIREILKLRRAGYSVKELGEEYGVSYQRIHQLTVGVNPEGKCRYCGMKIGKGTICSDCCQKRKLVRELLATANLIKKKAGRG